MKVSPNVPSDATYIAKCVVLQERPHWLRLVFDLLGRNRQCGGECRGRRQTERQSRRPVEQEVRHGRRKQPGTLVSAFQILQLLSFVRC